MITIVGGQRLRELSLEDDFEEESLLRLEELPGELRGSERVGSERGAEYERLGDDSRVGAE